jgi:hypothetical protein
MEYESVTQNIIACRMKISECRIKRFPLHFLIHKQFYFVTSNLKIIGHGNPDNNLESHFIKIKHNEPCGFAKGERIS